MTTYRKFDKYRQRADFMTEMFYGVDTQANVLISGGTGTPVFTPGGADGFVLGTSAGGTATSTLQRGTVSGTGRVAPVTLRKGRKAHVVADLIVEGSGIVTNDGFGFSLGFFEANADPLAQDGIGFTYGFSGEGEPQITTKVGATTVVHALADPLDTYIHEGHLALEVYYDGTDKVQFYMGRRRVAQQVITAVTDATEEGDVLIADPLSPTIGIANNGTASVNTIKVAVFGYAAQRVPFYGNA